MRLTLVAVGRLKERFWTEAAAEYIKRLRPYATLNIVEIADRDSGRDAKRALAEEGADVLRAIPEGSHVMALTLDGAQLTSERFAERLQQLSLEGRSAVTFIIGGSEGLAPEVVARADEKLSLGPMTLPHNLARVVLLEQLYRAFKISRNEPYHK